MRGRVIAHDTDGSVLVRSERGDGRAQIAAVPGDLIDQGAIVRRHLGGDYPGPGTEVMRLSRRRMDFVRERAQVLAAVRRFFAERDFTEVETPLLVPSPGLEIHLDAVPAGSGYLITSPEYQMKRLLAAGFERIYQVCKCFRAGEHGPFHSSEFSMIEWYRAFAPLEEIIRDTEQLVYAVCGPTARVGGRQIGVQPPWRRISVRDAMQQWAGVRVDGEESASDVVAAVRAAGIEVDRNAAWDDAFFAAFLARVEPAIAALDHALILEDWPAPLAALARRRPDMPQVALRFEAYVGGVELANAFDELTDAREQRARFESEQGVRLSRGKPVYPIDDKLIAALEEGLPPSAGIALGLDRLIMIATGADRIDDVLAFSSTEL